VGKIGERSVDWRGFQWIKVDGPDGEKFIGWASVYNPNAFDDNDALDAA
jgi:hypothetical protein